MKRGLLFIVFLFFSSTFVSAVGVGCISHDECLGSEACDFTSYTCVSSSVVHENLEEVSAGITPDNPYLGWVDALGDRVVASINSDPEVSERLSVEASQEARVLDERKEKGIITEERYNKAMGVAQERSVERLQGAYTALYSQSLRGEVAEYESQVARLDSLAGGIDQRIEQFQGAPGLGNNYFQSSSALRSQLQGTRQRAYDVAVGEFAPSLEEEEEALHYSCNSISSESVLEGFSLTSVDDTLSLEDSLGNIYVFTSSADGFSVEGNDIIVYVIGITSYTGDEISFISSVDQGVSQEETLGNEGSFFVTGRVIIDFFTGFVTSGTTVVAYYDVYVDSQLVGRVNLGEYGKSFLKIGDVYLSTYDVTDSAIRVFVGETLFLSLEDTLVNACQLELFEEEIESQSSFAASAQTSVSLEEEEVEGSGGGSGLSQNQITSPAENPIEGSSSPADSALSSSSPPSSSGSSEPSGPGPTPGSTPGPAPGSTSEPTPGPLPSSGQFIIDVPKDETFFSFWRFLVYGGKSTRSG